VSKSYLRGVGNHYRRLKRVRYAKTRPGSCLNNIWYTIPRSPGMCSERTARPERPFPDGAAAARLNGVQRTYSPGQLSPPPRFV
jgi:hypothetical protein